MLRGEIVPVIWRAIADPLSEPFVAHPYDVVGPGHAFISGTLDRLGLRDIGV